MTNSNRNSANNNSFCSFDNYRKKENTSPRTIGFCDNDVIEASSFSDGGYVEIKESGVYKFLIESDDGGSLSIGGISIVDDGPHSLNGKTGSGYLAAGFHLMSVSQFDIGAQLLPDGSYSKNSSAFYVKWGSGSPGGTYINGNTPASTPSSWASVPIWEIEAKPLPSLSPNPDTLYTNPLESEDGQSQDGVVTIYGEPGAGCTLQSSDPTALILGGITAVNSTSEYGHASMTAGTIPGEGCEEGKVNVTVTLKSSNGSTLATCNVTVQRNKCKPEEECSCTACGEGTSTGAKCISFGIAFGRSPHLAGAPTGQLKIEEDKPSAKIYTPAILHFNHPMVRKISYISADGRFINAINEIGDIVSYKDGVRYGNSSGIQSEIAILRNEDEEIIGYRETLPDRTTVYYNSIGDFDHIVTSENLLVSTANIGIDPILDSNGNIRQIWAASEGLLDVTTGTDSFVISWYKNDNVTGKDSTTGLYTFYGSPVKTFTFEKPSGTTGNNALHLTERRGTSFEFHYDWTYVTANSDWTIRKGSDTVFSLEAKARSAASNGNIILSYTTSGSDGGTRTTAEELSTTAQGNRIVGRTINGVSQMSGERNSSSGAGGRLGSSTDRSGNTTSYEYDEAGRTTKITRTGFGGLPRITKYEYGATVNDHLDTRPAKITEQLKNSADGIAITLSGTVYEYQDDTSIGRTETITQTVNGVPQVTKRCWWPISNTVESGRLMSELRPDGTMTLYEYSATSIETLDITNYATYSYTETITEGIKSNVAADHYFGIVPSKSTRKINTYDAAGNIVRTENYIHYSNSFRLISWEEHTYNPMHKVIASTYSNGKTSSADWICTGPVFEVDEDGIRTDYNYDALKRCTSKVRHSPNGDITTSYTYDAEGRVLSTTVSGGSGDNFVSETTSQTYDIEGRIATQTDGRGLVTSFSYSVDNLTTTETRPNGGTVITTRNLDGTIASITGTAVTPVFYTYTLDAVAGLEIMEEHYGTSTSKRWRKTYTNKFGQTVRIEESAWNETVKTTINTYNDKGQLVTTTSTDAPTVTYLYDNMGTVSQETVSDGETERIVTHAYQHVGYASSEYAMRRLNSSKCSDTAIPANSTYLFTQLSGFSNTLEQKTESKNTRSLSTLDWSSFDSTTKVRTVRHTEPGANTGTTTLIRDGLTLSETDAAGVTTTYTYDALGRQLTATDGRGNTTTNVYNNKGELVSTTDAANHTTTYTYSATTGELVTVTDANGKTVNYVYDLKGQKIAEYGTATYPVSFEYNTFGEMVKLFTYRNPNAVIVTNPNPADGDQTLWNYDESSGLLSSKTYADNKTVSYTYDVKGQLLTRTWARTNGTNPLVTSYAYNIYGELLTVTYSDETTPNVTNSYNAMGMLLATTDVSGENGRTYNTYREIATEANAVLGTALAIGRDNYGRETSSVLTQGESTLATTATLYNNNSGRITRGTFGTNQFNYTYLANSHLISQVTTCGGAAKKVFTYEPNRDLPTEIAFKLSNNSLIAKRNYTFDAVGRVATRTQTRGTDTARNDSFGYNDRSELTSATLGTDQYGYSFDNIGNRITAAELADEIAYSANNLNQYTAIEKNSGTPFVPTFDDDGNQLTVQTATGVWNVIYNAENRPITFTQGTTVIECKYDSQGRRFEKKVIANNVVTFWQRYAYKGYLQIAAFNVLSVNETEVLSLATTTYWDPTDPTATRPLAFTDHTVATPTTYFYTHDLTKNVCEILSRNGTAVSIATTYDYTPFGSVIASNTTTPNTFCFSSEVLDPETNLVYYNYRHYNPTDGRWISRDPIAEQGGQNLYAMVRNNPMALGDELGLFSDCWKDAQGFYCDKYSGLKKWLCKKFIGAFMTSAPATVAECETAYSSCIVCCETKHCDSPENCGAYCLGMKMKCMINIAKV